MGYFRNVSLRKKSNIGNLYLRLLSSSLYRTVILYDFINYDHINKEVLKLGLAELDLEVVEEENPGEAD